MKKKKKNIYINKKTLYEKGKKKNKDQKRKEKMKRYNIIVGI